MARDLGTKYTCFKCGTKFYDLKKPVPACPKCGADQRDAPTPKQVAAAARRAAAAPPREVEEVVEPVPVVEDEEAEAAEEEVEEAEEED